MSRKRGVVFFDMDGTITYRDTFLEFIKFYRGLPTFILGMVILSPFTILYFLHIFPSHKLKEFMFCFFFKNESTIRVIQKGIEFSEINMPSICRHSALKLIKWHQLRNDKIFIITASSNVWLQHWCDIHNLEIIGTVFETKNGFFTGKIKGENCKGLQKKQEVLNILKCNQPCISFGYGNEKTDRYFLNLLDFSYNESLTGINVSKIMGNYKQIIK